MSRSGTGTEDILLSPAVMFPSRLAQVDDFFLDAMTHCLTRHWKVKRPLASCALCSAPGLTVLVQCTASSDRDQRKTHRNR